MLSGWTPDLEELEGDLSEPSEEEEDNFSELQKTAILSLLEGISTEEAQAVPGLSESRAALLLARRPFQSWYHLVSERQGCMNVQLHISLHRPRLWHLSRDLVKR